MTRRTRRRSATFFAAFISVAMVASACTPPPPPTVKTWEFKSTQVTVNEANDCTLGLACSFLGTDRDEAYVLNVAFRVKIGEANSASAWVAGSRSNDTSVDEGQTKTLTGAAQNAATFTDVSTLDVANLSDNKLEVVGTYTWVMEKDQVGVNVAANDVADILEDALNSTLASAEGELDPSLILDLIFDNLGSSFTLLLSNIPLLGLGDDALGGAFYIGIGAKGGLATTFDGLLGSIPPPNFSVPVLDLPPDVLNFGVFTMQNTKVFSGQNFDNSCLIPQCGEHTYTFQANEV